MEIRKMFKPEILAPAGNIEKLRVAVNYGADAVYLGGQKFGLRARADNFTKVELRRACEFAHARGVKVYVTLNAFLHDEDFDGLEEYCQFLESIGVDAVIVSDLGVMRRVLNSSSLVVHLSTQASCLNTQSARLWKKLGATRIVLGRELSVAQAGQIAKEADLEVEIFIHGALCMAYSGNCTISNFTAGRDSNRGGCIQSCRFGYEQKSSSASTLPIVSGDTVLTPFMSSKDLIGTDVIPDLFEHQITSLKIEGRMKSPFHVGSTCRTYRKLVDSFAAKQFNSSQLESARFELEAVPNRGYCSGSLKAIPLADSVCEQEGGEDSNYRYLGIVLDANDDSVFVRLHAPLSNGQRVEFIPFRQDVQSHNVELYSVDGEGLEQARQDSVVRIKRTQELSNVEPLNIVRCQVEGMS